MSGVLVLLFLQIHCDLLRDRNRFEVEEFCWRVEFACHFGSCHAGGVLGIERNFSSV